MAKTVKSWWLLAAASALFILPALALGSGGNDLIYHVLWFQGFSEQLWSGILYPRWLPELNSGCGSPSFFYYPPLPFYLASLFTFAAGWKPVGWYPLVLAGWVSIIMGAVFVRLWLRQLVPAPAALYGAVAYLFMPYLWCVFYGMFSYAEFFTMVWLPLMLYATHRLAEGSARHMFVFALGYGALLLCTLPGAIVASCLPIPYLLVQKGGWRRINHLIVAHVLGFCIAAFFTFPVLALKGAAYVDTWMWMKETGGHYAANFMGAGLRDNIMLQFQAVLPLAVIAGIAVAVMVRRSGEKPQKREAVFWALVVAVVTFMQYPLSAFVWEWVPLIKYMQYPSRLMNIFTMALVALIALAVAMPQRQGAKHDTRWVVAVLFIALTLPSTLSYTFFRHSLDGSPVTSPINWGIVGEGEVRTGEMEEFFERTRTLYRYKALLTPEYLPRWVPLERMMKEGALAEYQGLCEKQVTALAGDGSVSVVSWKPREITLKVQATTLLVFRVGQFYFPGWKAGRHEGDTWFVVEPEEETGLILVRTPPGTHEVQLTLRPGRAEKYGPWVSLASLLVALGGLWFSRGSRRAAPIA